MGNFKRYLSGRCKIRRGGHDFAFLYHANETYPSAYVIVDLMLIFDMDGTQIGSVNDDGFFFKINSPGYPIAFYDEGSDSICDSNGGDFLAVVEKNSLPYFNQSRPTFAFNDSAYRVYDYNISNSTGSMSCSYRLSNKKLLDLF